MFYIIVCTKYDNTYIVEDGNAGVIMGFDTYDKARAEAVECFDEINNLNEILIMQVVDNIPAFVASFWWNPDEDIVESDENPARLR